jgi:inhibitor of cysteine peptidase
MLKVDQAQNGSSLEVSPGGALEVRLPENPTTGYRWQLHSAGDQSLEIKADSFERSPGGVGAGGTRCWRFHAAQAGRVHLEFSLRRSWQPQPVETFRITVVVKAL